jgi:hypothetical protein
MKNIVAVLFMVMCMVLTSCKKEGTVTVYVKQQLSGQALNYAPYALVTAYESDSVTQVSTATANQFGVVAIDLKEGDYLIYAQAANDTNLTGATIATVKKGQRVDVNVTIQ